ncbi:hypothetical protein RAS1_14850 [Phycisphaerae bacterium RAS1]|nr:hypothetical protein RAS1_14850 [Phycisphaerae bacterium RAS1]
MLNEGTAFSLPSPHTAAYNRYGYNDRNELTTAYRYLGDDLEDTDDPVPNEHFKYDYDPIGNRRGSWMGPEGEDPLVGSEYNPTNGLNQYERVATVSGIEESPSISNWIGYDEDGRGGTVGASSEMSHGSCATALRAVSWAAGDGFGIIAAWKAGYARRARPGTSRATRIFSRTRATGGCRC